MRRLVLSTLTAFVVVAGLLLVERSWRLNRPVSKSTSQTQTLPQQAQLKNVATQEIIALGKFSGKVVFINFWASWCDACIIEMESIVKLNSILKAEGLEVISINIDENPAKIVPSMVAKLKLNFPVYTDEDETIAKTFNVVAIPYSIVADRKMKVVWSESGERDWASTTVLAEIKKLLKET